MERLSMIKLDKVKFFFSISLEAYYIYIMK